MAYKTNNLNLEFQSLGGAYKSWTYHDTGSPISAVDTVSGFFTDAGNKGASTGDKLTYINYTSNAVYTGHFSEVVDTGATQGTAAIGDTH